jgi:hypothetical protein
MSQLNLQTEYITFRCSKRLKELLDTYAMDHDLFISQIIRIAIDRFFFNSAAEKFYARSNLDSGDFEYPVQQTEEHQL